MDPIESIQVSWLWKLIVGMGFSFAALVGYAWTRMDSRITSLEQTSANHEDIRGLRSEIRDLGDKIERLNERNEERAQKMLDIIVQNLRHH